MSIELSLLDESIAFLLLQRVDKFLHLHIQFVTALKFTLDPFPVLQHGVHNSVLLPARVPHRIRKICAFHDVLEITLSNLTFTAFLY
jgi:hypothetical protein